MKQAILQILLSLLICGVIITTSCARLHPRSPKSTPVEQASSPTFNKANAVSYKGVSFTFDLSLASEVKSETIAAMTDGKPSDIVPEHPAFALVGYPRTRSMSENDPQIRVFSVARFRDAFSIAGEEFAKSVVYPKERWDWAKDFDEEFRVLRALLEKQPKHEELKTFLMKVRAPEAKRFDDFPQMPFLPMWEASQAFFARPQYFRFKNGRGVSFVTQWNVTDTSQVTNDGLEYAFQGITDDDQYLVYAEFSIRAPFLPNDSDADVATWNEKNYLLPQRSKKYQDYLRPIVAKLQELPDDQYKPNLKLLERLIASMEVHPN